MKSPDELSLRFARQWDNADLREQRVLGAPGAWPISLPIGRPASGLLSTDLDAFKQHLNRWRKRHAGEVVWALTNYRAAAEPIEIPTHWQLNSLPEWIAACGQCEVANESKILGALIAKTDAMFHSVLLRRRSLWRRRSVDEVVQATKLALALEPGCAKGTPLRTISLAGIDTKFFERNENLVIELLDARFGGEVGELGLATFLGAVIENDHWLLVADLDGDLLPFRKLRVPSFELMNSPLPGHRLLIVENESSLHQLPDLPGTVAVLGSGFDLGWTKALWTREKDVAYWGDIDTWGLQFLAKARESIPALRVLLMNEEVFDTHRDMAVVEAVHAGGGALNKFLASEEKLFERLLIEDRGRLEQEFLPIPLVRAALADWANAKRCS